MLFNSLTFLIFAALFFSAWPMARRGCHVRWIYLVGASFVFYGWWDWRFLFLIVASGLVDFFAGLGMEAYPRRKKLFLLFSLFGNLGSLAVFKYSSFIASNLDRMFASAGWHTSLLADIPDFMLILPVGISFYTFQSMSYTIDVYRGQLKPTRNFMHFMAYLSLFPQLVAGPIVRARDLLPQLHLPGRADASARWQGLRLIVHGLFKKMVIADNLGPVVDAAFGAAAMNPSTFFWWFIMTAFAFQIYCDFSGYSDIARGLAKWMGYDFDRNFNHPYNATSLSDFWRRWHISLSTWFRDYVYIPLGGSRRGAISAHVNMWATMVLSGFWHGAAWTFVIWGALHAAYLSIERLIRWPDFVKRLPVLGGWIATALVLVQVWVAWVFFRATSFDQALGIVVRMFSFEGGLDLGRQGPTAAVFLTLGVLRECYCRVMPGRLEDGPSRWPPALDILVLAAVIAAVLFLRGPGEAFIYFQF